MSRDVRDTLRGLRCVQAGWAFGVPPEGQEEWLDEVAAAVGAEITRLRRERDSARRAADQRRAELARLTGCGGGGASPDPTDDGDDL